MTHCANISWYENLANFVYFWRWVIDKEKRKKCLGVLYSLNGRKSFPSKDFDNKILKHSQKVYTRQKKKLLAFSFANFEMARWMYRKELHCPKKVTPRFFKIQLEQARSFFFEGVYYNPPF